MEFLPSFLQTYFHQREMIDFLKKSETWSKEKWNQYQLNQLNNLLHHCNTHVPYYKSFFKKYDVKIDNIESFEDIKKIPFLTKKDIRNHIINLKSQGYPKKDFEQKMTSGTTGKPLTIYLEKRVWLAHHLAFNKMYMKRGGYRRNEKVVSLLGIKQKSRYHVLFNTLELSSLHLHYSFNEMIGKIKKFNPLFIVSYPSAIYFLAKYFKDMNKPVPFCLKCIFCHGEPLYDWQRQIINKIFSCPVLDIYGNAERNVLSATCEQSNLHHIFPNYCIVELVDAKGKPVTEENTPGEIVSTGLLSPIFPFIRYKTGDVGIYTNKQCTCNRNYPLIKKIAGRLQDAIITHQNKLIHVSALNEVIDIFGKGVSKWQFHQSEKGKVHLELMLFENFFNDSAIIKKGLMKGFNEAFHQQIEVKISIKNRIDSPGIRKHHFLIQNMTLKKRVINSD